MKIALAAAAALIATPALAATQTCSFEAANGAEARVRYDDLDLSRQRDQRYFLARVDRAVDRVCGVDPYQRIFVLNEQADQCVTETAPIAEAAARQAIEAAA